MPGLSFDIDKDLMIKGNKIYGPDTCVMIPEPLNLIIVGCADAKGYNIDKKNKKNPYRVSLSSHIDGKKHTIHIGAYPNPEEAIAAYKQARQQTITELANQYKEYLEPRVYEALLNFHF